MCYGQFSVTDPRCHNWARSECFWCDYTLVEKLWPTVGELLKHKPDCYMRKLGEDIERDINDKT